MAGSLVLDTSAVMAMLAGEPEAETAHHAVAAAIERGEALLMPFVVMTEMRYLLARRYSDPQVEGYMELVSSWPMQLMESTPSWGRETARVKAAGDISFADAWVAALGLIHGCPVVHKDPQFENVPGLRTVDIRTRS